MPRTISDLTAIDYDDIGRGDPALLLLPGWCASRKTWDGLLEPLQEQHRVLALDWRGHGESGAASGDFGETDLVRDALAVMEDSGARRFVPVALGQAGWVALDLRRRLREVVLGVVLVDWIVTPAPAAYLDMLERMRLRHEWRATVDQTLEQWAAGLEDADLLAFLDEMGAMPADMWDRAAREVEGSYALHTSPLDALAALDPPLPALHLYAQPDDDEYLEYQQQFAAAHEWFAVQRLPARTHFPMFEVAELMGAAITDFVMRAAAGRVRRAA
jgi:pimeloyl-ACP methyl ester carboxylesterase